MDSRRDKQFARRKAMRKLDAKKRRLRKSLKMVGRSRIPRSIPIPRQEHVFTERVIQEYNLPVNGAGLFQTFQFADMYNNVSYSKLFEYYKINKVIITLRYKADLNPRLDVVTTSQPGTTAPNEANPIIWFKVDHNDVTADSLDTLKSSSRTKEIQFTNNRPKIEIVLKPAVLSESYKSAVASTYVPKWGQWLTTQDTTVPHYGIKMYATGPAAQTYGGIVMTKQYYFTCKNNE